MKIFMAHNYYRSSSPSGEDVSFEAEAAMLKNFDHEVITYKRKSDEVLNRGIQGKLAAFKSSINSSQSYDEVGAILDDFKPNIAHFQNIHPLISPSAFRACRERQVPVVMALRNYRLLCPQGMQLRGKEVCKECQTKSFKSPAIRHSCYQTSKMASAAMVTMLYYHHLKDTWAKDVDAFVMPGQVVKDIFNEAKWDVSNFFVKPNIVGAEHSPFNETEREYGLYVGRLSDEKGIETLMNALKASPKIKFKIIGSGNLETWLREFIEPDLLGRIEFLGRKNKAETLSFMRDARFLVFPSIWEETFGRTILEAFLCGTPVIASDIGAPKDLLKNNNHGVLVEPKNAEALGAAMQKLWNDPGLAMRMGRSAYEHALQEYSEQKNHDILMEIYQFAIKRSAEKRGESDAS